MSRKLGFRLRVIFPSKYIWDVKFLKLSRYPRGTGKELNCIYILKETNEHESFDYFLLSVNFDRFNKNKIHNLNDRVISFILCNIFVLFMCTVRKKICRFGKIYVCALQNDAWISFAFTFSCICSFKIIKKDNWLLMIFCQVLGYNTI